MATATSCRVVGEREAAQKAARVSPFWQVLIVLIGVLVLAHDSNKLWDYWNGNPEYGTLGAELDMPDFDGFGRIAAVTPGGPMAVQGVGKGDAVRFDRGVDASRRFRVGETVGFTVRRGSALSHRAVTAGPRPAPSSARIRGLLLNDGLSVMIGLIGLFVVLRSRGHTPTVLLGFALVCLGMEGSFPSLVESDPRLFPGFYGFATAVLFAQPLLFLAFARAARRETSGKAPRNWAIITYAYGVAQTLSTAYDVWHSLTSRALPGIDPRALYAGGIALTDFGFLLAILALGVAWRESRGRDRTRYAFMLVAISLLSCGIIMALLVNLTGNDWRLNNPLELIELVSTVSGAGVFAYAVLRHRILDIGFAVNRTLVYGVVSAVMLAAFGLIEWAVDHFVPIEGREKNALVDAAVAVGVFLTFHRVRDGVEQVIERMFFHRWQKAEAALRLFVKEAAFFAEAPGLTQAFVQAVSDYAEGAPAAVYLAEGLGYARAAGDLPGVPARLAADLRALVSLRADPKPIEIHEKGLKAALIAPMVNRNEVVGLAVLGPKPSGLDLRPDEIELVGWATRQVGLDLHALKTERLEGSEADLRKENATLRSLIPTASVAASV